MTPQIFRNSGFHFGTQTPSPYQGAICNEVFMNGHSSAKSLFGGAIKTVFPDHFLDASYFPSLCKWLMPRNFRSVPDNQEVFVSNLDDTSIIFDILEQVPASDASAAEFHFDALAVDNEVDEDDDGDSRVFSTRALPSSEHSKLPSVPCWTLAGYQRVVKGYYRGSVGRAPAGLAQYVIIFLVVFRFAEKETDVVISLNYPVGTEEEVAAIHGEDVKDVLAWIDEAPGVSDAENVLKDIVANLEILDWSLFDEGDEEE